MSRQSSRRRSGRSSNGFTLIELLVSVVILAFVIAVMSSAFGQVAQIVRVASEAGNSFQTRWLQIRALHDAMAGLTLSDSADPPFIGTPQSISCLTLAAPTHASGVLQAMNLQLKTDRSAGTTTLMLDVQPPPDGKAAFRAGTSPMSTKPETALQWVTWPAVVQFRFVDRAGTEHSDWPPMGQSDDLLPVEVRVTGSDRDRTVWRSAVFEGRARPEKNSTILDVLGLKN